MEKCNQDILNLLAGKSSTKQFVYRQTREIFSEFKERLQEIANELNSNICQIDDNVVVEYIDKGSFEAEIRFSGDALIFHMHTNIFTFEKSHFIHKSSYIQKEPLNAYFGVINIYNFLSDSLKYNRANDFGQLIGRLFINREKHFFIDGKRQFGFLHKDIANDIINKENLRQIIEKAMIYALDFDLTSPNFNDVRMVTVNQIRSLSSSHKIRTSKKLGFKFSHDKERPKS